MFIHLCVIGLLLCIIPHSRSDICSTCLCSTTDEGPIINCYGKHLGSNDMLNVDLLMLDGHQTLNELILSNNSIIHLPGNLLKKLKRLKSLDLSENVMEEIHYTAFTDLNNLEDLNFSKNQLKMFDDSVFKTLPALLVLNLSHNNISAIEHTIGESAAKIVHLDLSHNNILNLSSDSFASLRSLTFLDLSFNKIHSLRNESLRHLSSLRTLRLSNNYLSSLHLQAFPKSLMELYTGYNSITEIYYEPSQIQVLDIESNRVDHIDKNIIMINHLQHLNVRANMLSNFPSVTLASLKSLDISANKLSNMPETFSVNNFPQLVQLTVSGNPIRELRFLSNLRLRSFIASNISVLESIDQDAFSKLKAPPKECINLTISNNERLSSVHEIALNHMDLCFLDLSNNHLSHISSNLIASNASFKTYAVNLQGNPFNCNCSLQWMLNELVPKLYNSQPHHLDNLRCALPPQISNMRMVHWYGWKSEVFCTDMTDFAADLKMNVASASSSKVITFDSSPGLLAVVATAIAVFTIMVIVGLLLTRKLDMRKTRINRRF